MRAKSFLLTLALCGAVVSLMAQQQAAADSTEMGVHPYKETSNMAWDATGFSMVLHGGINIFDGDYPGSTGRFSNFGYPTAGIDFEYNFSPVWGLGIGYNFAMPKVTFTSDTPGGFIDEKGNPLTVNKGDIMYRAMMHSGQVFITFNLVNAWFPRAVRDIFGLSVFAGVGGTMYKNSISFHDTGKLNEAGTAESDSWKYVKDGDNAQAHNKFESVAYIPMGASAEFNVSRQVALGARFQYNMYLNDYVDNRYQSRANKNNDGRYDVELLLRWKIAAKKKNHFRNVASTEVMEDKYYTAHPHRRPRRPHQVDTVLFYHRDTIVIIHRDTVYIEGQRQMTEQPVTATQEVVVSQQEEQKCDLELYPGWEAEADAVVVEGQSLSQIARKYYKNTFCWVYLWIANRSIAPDPNLIMPKCVLKVPKLTEDCQKKITKQEAKDMCARYRAEE